MLRSILNWLLAALKKPTPTPVPPQPVPTPPSGNFIADLLKLHNDHRQSIGLSPLVLNNTLNQAAQNHSVWMNANNNLSHDENGVDPGARLTKLGYRWNTYGENIAMGYATPSAVFAGWLSSSGHRRNIENPSFVEVGFGLSGTYWTTDFGRRI